MELWHTYVVLGTYLHIVFGPWYLSLWLTDIGFIIENYLVLGTYLWRTYLHILLGPCDLLTLGFFYLELGMHLWCNYVKLGTHLWQTYIVLGTYLTYLQIVLGPWYLSIILSCITLILYIKDIIFRSYLSDLPISFIFKQTIIMQLQCWFY